MSKLVKCKSCGAEIAKSTKACPRCGAKKKNGCLSAVFSIIAIFLVLVIIVAAFGGDSEPSSAPNGNHSQTSQTGTSSDDATSKSADSAFSVGDRVEMNNIYVTLNNVTESEGSTYNTPTEGNVFIICEFTIENETSSELAISSMLSFTAYADDYAVNYSLGGMMESDKQQLDGTIAANKKMNGTVAFEAPEDWTEFEIHFSPSIYSSKEFVFVYNK